MSIVSNLVKHIASRDGKSSTATLSLLNKHNTMIPDAELNAALKCYSRQLTNEMRQFISSTIKWHNDLCDSQSGAEQVLKVAIDMYRKCLSILFTEEHYHWALNLLIFVCINMRRSAAVADAETVKAKPDDSQETMSLSPNQDLIVQELRSPLGRFRNEKDGAYAVLFYSNLKMSMALNNYQFTTTLVKNAEEFLSSGYTLSGLPTGAVVSFNFYLGKIQMITENFAEADKRLSEALRLTRSDSLVSRKRILEILIPVKIRMGRLPSKTLLDELGNEGYIDIVESVKNGNVKLFDRTVRDHKFRAEMLKSSTLLVIEKCRMLVYRQLFKLTSDFWAKYVSENPACGGQGHIVKLGLFEQALKWQMEGEQQIDSTDLIYIFANLKQNNMFKGYIALESQRVVLLKNGEAFPIPK
eukprot:GDKJ01013001.1.p1 GENE.GDKJ01013001.1~~GDKJ01013001.1.p1  ORF type:complete len:413 (-),score=74.48 GDKJ01013001.1:59-1297(-)